MERGKQVMENIFNCLRCGVEIEQNIRNSRKYCPECAEIMRLERDRQYSRERLAEERETNAIKAAGKQVEKSAFLEEHKKADKELDARSRKQRQLQCRFCKYQLRHGSKGKLYCIGCDYISWKKHSRDKGNGPGDCRSFEPLTKAAKAERMERRRKALLEVEANNAQNTGEKMRGIN